MKLSLRAQSWNVFLLIWCVCLIVLDVYMSVPSLWAYMESLGSSKLFYGTTTFTAYFASAISSLVFGRALDSGWTFKANLLVNLSVCAVAGLLYFSAEIVDQAVANSGIYIIALSRILISITNGATGPSVLVYIARYTQEQDRTKLIALFAACSKLATVVGPGLSAIFVVLPEVSVGSIPAVFNNYTYVGLMNFVNSIICIILVICLFTEPPQLPEGPRGWELPEGVTIWVHLWRTSAWVNLVTTFVVRLNFSIFLYYLPIFADEHLGWGQQSMSTFFLGVGGVTLCYLAPVAAVASQGKVMDRSLMLFHYLCILASIVGIAVVSRCGSASPNKVLFVVFYGLQDLAFLGQAVGNTSLYQKLVGQRGVGSSQAIFNANNIVGQAIGGQVLGLFLSSGNACAMLACCAGLSVIQVLVVITQWRYLDPVEAQKFHGKELDSQAKRYDDVEHVVDPMSSFTTAIADSADHLPWEYGLMPGSGKHADGGKHGCIPNGRGQLTAGLCGCHGACTCGSCGVRESCGESVQNEVDPLLQQLVEPNPVMCG